MMNQTKQFISSALGCDLDDLEIGKLDEPMAR